MGRVDLLAARVWGLAHGRPFRFRRGNMGKSDDKDNRWACLLATG